MTFSAFKPFGLWQFTDDVVAQNIYETLRASMSRAFQANDITEFFSEEGEESDDVDADLYATAIQVAAAVLELRQAGVEMLPSKMWQTLRTNERDLGITPTVGQTVADRRAIVGTALLAALGSSRPRLEYLLERTLGADFVGLATETAGGGTSVPADEETGILYTPAGQDFAVMRLTGPASKRALEFVKFELVRGTMPQKGSLLLVDPEDRVRAEVVEILNYSYVAPDWYVYADWTQPHDPGTVCTTGSWPLIETTQRHMYVMLSQNALTDTELLRRADLIMQKTVRGITTWSLCVENSPGSGVSGPYTFASPLGLTPMVEVTV